MSLASSGGQFHLLLTFLKARPLGSGQVIVATGTRNTFLIVLRCHIRLGDGMAAGITLIKTTFFKPVIHRYTRIKNEALALPSRFRFRYVFKIL